MARHPLENSPMTSQIKAEFENQSWKQDAYDEPEQGAKLIRADVHRVFRGDLAGESDAILLMSHAGEQAGFVASERVVGTLDGRRGSFVLHHGATMGEENPRAFGYVVPGSGSDELTGLSGECTWYHDDKESVFTLTYELP
jgi:hypothetical protein